MPSKVVKDTCMVCLEKCVSVSTGEVRERIDQVRVGQNL